MSTQVSPPIAEYLSRELAAERHRLAEGWYPDDLLQQLGCRGAFAERDALEWERSRFALIEAISERSTAAAFITWCHTAVMAYLRAGRNQQLAKRLLPKLESGEVVGATGLSNAMKFYSGLEPLLAQARRTTQGYRLRGTLPAVSNVVAGGVMGVVASVDGDHRLLAIVPVEAAGVYIEERHPFIALNGTATYRVRFEDVPVPEDWVVDENADALVRRVRGGFVWTQSAMAFGAIRDLRQRLTRIQNRWRGWDLVAPTSWSQRCQEADTLRLMAWKLGPVADPASEAEHWRAVLHTRAQATWLLLDLVRDTMVGLGAGGYCRNSYGATRWGEALFLAIVTPSLKHIAWELGRLRDASADPMDVRRPGIPLSDDRAAVPPRGVL